MVRFRKVSAFQATNACAIVTADEDGEEATSWVVGFFGKPRRLIEARGVQLTGLWQSKKGALYVAGLDGTLHMNRTPKKTPELWSREETTFALRGVWGVSDESVYAWSLGGDVLRFDGARWAPMPALGDEIVAIHGKSDNALVAVGSGVVAGWDGDAWQRLAVEDEDVFTGVHVVDDDEIWISGHGGLYRASFDGSVTLAAETDGDVCHTVTCYRGRVYVASEDPGLLVFDEEEGTLVPADDAEPMPCVDLDGRGQLFVVGEDEIFVRGEDGDEGSLSIPNESLLRSMA